MITKSEAQAIASQFLSIGEGSRLVILESQTMEKSFGWVFFYDSRKHYETQDPKYLIAGNAPIIVDRKTGELRQTGTAHPIEFYIEEYETVRK